MVENTEQNSFKEEQLFVYLSCVNNDVWIEFQYTGKRSNEDVSLWSF